MIRIRVPKEFRKVPDSFNQKFKEYSTDPSILYFFEDDASKEIIPLLRELRIPYVFAEYWIYHFTETEMIKTINSRGYNNELMQFTDHEKENIKFIKLMDII